MGAQKSSAQIPSTENTSSATTQNSSSKSILPVSTSGPLNLSCKAPLQHSISQSHRKEDNNNQLDKLDIEMFQLASKSPNGGSGLGSLSRNPILPGAYDRPCSPKVASSAHHSEEAASLAAFEMLRKTKSMLFPSPPGSILAPSGGSSASSPSPHHHPHLSFRASQNNGQHLPDVVSTLPIFSPNHPHFKSSPAGDSILMGQKNSHLHQSLFGTNSSSEQLRFSSLDYSPFRGFPGGPPHAPPVFPGFGSHFAAAAAAAAAAASVPGASRGHESNGSGGSHLPSTHHSNVSRGNMDGKQDSQNEVATCQSKIIISYPSSLKCIDHLINRL